MKHVAWINSARKLPHQLFGSVSKKHVLHGDATGSDLERVVESLSWILNEGLGVSAGLGFYHCIPLIYVTAIKVKNSTKNVQ